MPRTLVPLGLALAAALGLSACGNSADTSPNPTAPSVPPKAASPTTPTVNTPTNAPPPSATVAPPPADMPPGHGIEPATTGSNAGTPSG